MIRPCRCPPRLAGRRRTTGSLRDSDEGPGAAGAGAVSRRARPCNGQGSRCRKRHFTLLEWLAREFRKIFFPKIPAVARYHSQRPESHSDAMTRHSGPARAARGTYCDPSHSSRTATSPAHSPRPESLAAARRSSLSTARLARRSPSHSQRPAVTRSGLPKPAAGRHSSRSQRPAVTRHSPPQSTRPRHSPRPVSLGWRRGPPLLAAARLAASVTRRRRGAKAEVYVVARIWNTLIAIFGTP